MFVRVRDLGLQLQLAAGGEPRVKVLTDLPLCFLGILARVNCGATSPFTLNSEVKLGPTEKKKKAFVLQKHSMSRLRMTSRSKVKVLWLKCNCPALSPHNKAQEVIKTPSPNYSHYAWCQNQTLKGKRWRKVTEHTAHLSVLKLPALLRRNVRSVALKDKFPQPTLTDFMSCVVIFLTVRTSTLQISITGI